MYNKGIVKIAVITVKCPFMPLTELCPSLCRYIRYTRKRGDEYAMMRS